MTTTPNTWTITHLDGTTETGGTTKVFTHAVVLVGRGGGYVKLALCGTEKAARSKAASERRYHQATPGTAYADAIVVPVVMG